MNQKVSDFLTGDPPPFLLGAFFSRYMFTSNTNTIYTYSSFKSSSYEQDLSIKEYKTKYLKQLNNQSAPYIWELKETTDTFFKARLLLENDLNLTGESFFNKLYKKIFADSIWLFDDELNEQKKTFFRGFMELRGSVDTTMLLIAQDYFYNSVFESKRARIFVDYFNIPPNAMNLNFRELQSDYVMNINRRNTQLRINAKWYMRNIGMLNKYKADIFSNAYGYTDSVVDNDITYFKIELDGDDNRNLSNTFDERLNYYSKNIYNKEITDQDRQEMREALGFEGTPTSIRNSALVELIRYNTPDECLCCKEEYEISDRSFIHRKTGKPYLEIHHVISLGNNKDLDDEDNLVKVCPVCHTCLKKGVGTESEQKRLILNLLDNAPNVREFSTHIFDTPDINEITQNIFRSLK